MFDIMEKKTSRKRQPIPEEGIYDARQLGMPRMLLLGLQHMFAMFGATILVPALTGLSVSATLLFAGLGTLLFHLVSKRKVPAFLGSSFAFLGGYFAVEGWAKAAGITDSASLLPYAWFGVACAGALNITIGSVTIGFTGLAVGALVGILLNAVLPDKEWQFREKIKNVHKMNIKENKDERNSN